MTSNGATAVMAAGLAFGSPLRLGFLCADPGRDRRPEVRRGIGRSRARPSCLPARRRHAFQPVRQDGEPALWSKRLYVLVLGHLRRRWDYTMVSRCSANPLGIVRPRL